MTDAHAKALEAAHKAVMEVPKAHPLHLVDTAITAYLRALAGEREDLLDRVETAIKKAPAERIISGKHVNALGHVIMEKMEYVVTNRARAKAALTASGLLPTSGEDGK